jgi:hypothetical protein
VDGYSRQEVAGKAGVDVGYVDRLVEQAILKPGTEGAFSQGDIRRARWVHSLEAAGVPLDGIAAAVRDGTISFSFMDASAFDRFAELSGTTFLGAERPNRHPDGPSEGGSPGCRLGGAAARGPRP